jgi:cytoplasmic iron level regulating protein YaaA (DUF328/UPF0246 family)
MLIILSPAKTLDFEKARIVAQKSFPEFNQQAAQLIQLLKKYSIPELREMMDISDKLASLNFARYKHWQKEPDENLMRQAICAFNGDAYTGLNVSDWSDADFAYSQEHLQILSGLYGVLRPLDYISPYRLEMGIKLPNKKGDSLYGFWGNQITKNLSSQLKSQGDSSLINLASNEYFKAVRVKELNAEVITPVFKDAQNGEYKVVSFFAKKARGMMSRFIIKNRIAQPQNIKEFTDGGYSYNDRLSRGNEWVFTRG